MPKARGKGADFAALMGAVVERLGGSLPEINRAMTRPGKELRLGGHGSLSIDLEKGTWTDFSESDPGGKPLGGGTVELIERAMGLDKPGALEQLVAWGLIPPATGKRKRHEPPPPEDNALAGFELDRAPQPNGHDRVVEFRGPEGWPAGVPKHARLVGEYPYTDEHGTLAFCVCKYEWENEAGEREKTYRPRDPQGKFRSKGLAQYPYRLPEVLAAFREDEVVFILEGEKDVDNAWRAGVPATCNAGGAGKWPDEISKWFGAQRVGIGQDNDDAGRKHAQLVALKLHKVVHESRIVEFPDVPPKGDFSDWIAQGNDPTGIYNLFDRSPVYRPPRPQTEFGELTVEDLRAPRPKFQWSVRGLIPRQSTVLIVGEAGAGKTFLLLDLAASVAKGAPFFNRATRRGIVLYQAAEGGRGVEKRLQAYMQNKGLPDGTPFVLMPRRLNLFQDDRTPANIIEAARQWEAYYDLPVEVVIIDTFAAASTGLNENDGSQVGLVLEKAEAIKEALGCAVIIVHHKNAMGERERGWSGLRGAVDTVLFCERDAKRKDENRREIRSLIVSKQKDDEDRLQIDFVLHRAVVDLDDEGQEITSCFVETPEGEDDASKRSGQAAVALKGNNQLLFDLLLDGLDAHGLRRPEDLLAAPPGCLVIHRDHWRDAAIFKLGEEGTPEQRRERARKAVERAITKFQTEGLIGFSEPFVWLTGRKVQYRVKQIEKLVNQQPTRFKAPEEE